MGTSIVEAAFQKAVKENLCNNTRDARLAFEIAWKSKDVEIVQVASNALQVMEFDEQRLSEAGAQATAKDAEIAQANSSMLEAWSCARLAEQKLSEAQAQIAMQAEESLSWKESYEKWIKDAAWHLGKDKLTLDESRIAYFAVRDFAKTLSVTSETVAAWRAKETEPLQEQIEILTNERDDARNQCAYWIDRHRDEEQTSGELRLETEPLRREVAMQNKCIELFFNCFDILTDGPDESDEAQAMGYLQEARELRTKLKVDTQATALAYDQEVKAKAKLELITWLYDCGYLTKEAEELYEQNSAQLTKEKSSEHIFASNDM